MKTAVLIVLLLAARAAFGDVTVDTTADEDVDDAACSLREAIVAVNTNASYHGCARSAATVDVIDFDLGTGTPTIAVTGSELPRFSGPLIVDGATGGATRVEIAGGGSFSTGLSFLLGADATGSEIRNLVINGFTSSQLLLSNGSGMVVEGNLIGTDPAGTALVAGTGVGIEICTGFSCGTSNGHRIGGTTAAARNVIAAGGSAAIVVSGGSPNNVIQGSFINVDAAGAQRVSSGFTAGIVLSNTAGTVIGGPNPGEGNVMTGFDVIVITGNPAFTPSSGTVIQGNLIGTDVTGTLDLGGGGDGIVLGHAVNTQVGGLAAAEGNLISGNVQGLSGGSSGVNGTSVDDTTVQGNLIGTDASGTGALGNSSFGVHLGDDAVIEGNVIAFNGGDGIETGCFACTQRISGNAIHSNTGIGIDLNGGNGVTANDTGDGDAGPNGRQNFPILDVIVFPVGTSISGTLDSTPSTTFRVEIFVNDACDPSGNGEGQELVGFKDVTTDANGDAAFTVSLLESVPAGTAMTATAIAPDGSTSEFSPCTLPPPPTTSTSTSTTTSSTAPPSTTSTSPTTSTAPTTTTSSTSTSSSTAPLATSTSTSTSVPVTTTTVPASSCEGVPDGPTFVSIDCRLEALRARLAADSTLEQLGPKLARNVERARARTLDAEDLCRTSNLKKTKKRLQQAATALTQYTHRLNGLRARERLAATMRQSLVDQGAPIHRDLRTLRGAVRCPDDPAGV